jgi:hypothetical protein
VQNRISIEEMVQKLEAKAFPLEVALTEAELSARITILEQQKRALLNTVKRHYNDRMRVLAKQREELLTKFK